jgi:hypothetical protein
MIDNRCEVCRFFSADASDWPKYDATASCQAQGYLAQLHKDVTDSVDIIEKFLQDMSWYLLAANWSWSLDLSHHITDLLMARSSLILFFLDSLLSYNPDAHRGDKNHSRDTLNADWSQNDCRAQLLMQAMNIRYKTSGPGQTLDGYNLVFRICSIVHSTSKAMTPQNMDAVKQIVTHNKRATGNMFNPHSNISTNDIACFLAPVEQLISTQSKSASFLARHASCFSTRFAYETAFILLNSGCFVIENIANNVDKLVVPKSCPLHLYVGALKSCETGIDSLHILTLLAYSMQPSTALEMISQSKEDAGIEIERLARRLVKEYCHAGSAASSQLMGGKKLMTSMAVASQLATTPSTSSQFSAHALPLPPISVIPNGDPASVSNSDHSDDSEYNTDEEPYEENPEDHESDDDSGDSR